MRGEVMVVGHQGNQKIWGLPETFLPRWVERKELTEQEAEREGAERTIRALGTASPSEINVYFLRGRYLNLKKALEHLQKESAIRRVQITGLAGKGERYVHDLDIPLLESMHSDAWQPRMSLLAPFDNLISGKDRTNRMFDFDYVHENYLPKNKRKFGSYVLPILWGDRFIGRVDPQMDREHERLLINSVHAEPGTPGGQEGSLGVREPNAAVAVRRARRVDSSRSAALKFGVAPDDDFARAIFAFRKSCLEQKIVERVVLNMNREALYLGIFAWPLRNCPRDQSRSNFQSEVVVETPSPVLLDHESAPWSSGPRSPFGDDSLGHGDGPDGALRFLRY